MNQAIQNTRVVNGICHRCDNPSTSSVGAKVWEHWIILCARCLMSVTSEEKILERKPAWMDRRLRV